MKPIRDILLPALAVATLAHAAQAQETTLRLVSAFAENGIYVVHMQ
jgi:hypothetical protein